MKKMFFLAATAALALSSCSSDELVQAEQPVVEDGAVLFSAYSGRATRATGDFDKDATDGDDTNVTIKYMADNGFGVFAYEQGDKKLDSYLATNTYPNFMFNQKVTGTQSDDATTYSWTYTPVKYWPNNSAYVSYQAYAPYDKDIEPLFGVAYKGVGIRYNNSDNYDLLWGSTAATNAYGDGGQPSYCDQQKPSVGDKTKFYFKHALSKLDFTVSYFCDENGKHEEGNVANGKNALNENTEIVIRSIRLVGTFPTQGVLSLYDGSWTVEKADDHVGYTAKDLVVSGVYEGAGDAATFKWKDGETDPRLTGGKEGTLTNKVVALKPESSLMVIPAKKIGEIAVEDKYHVEIVYDVITKDVNDDRNTSVVTNTITSGHSFNYPDSHSFEGITLKAGQHTTLNIHLGMTTAKFDAHVVDWEVNTTTAVDLSDNKDGSDDGNTTPDDDDDDAPSNRR